MQAEEVGQQADAWADAIKKIVKGGKPNFGKIKLRKDEITELYPDINKIKDYFKWKPKIGLKKGISLLVNYDK